MKVTLQVLQVSRGVEWFLVKKWHDRSLLFQARCIFPSDSSDWTERINIGSCQDELDPAILEKLLHSSAMAAASVHKYWTSIWARAIESTDLLELIKMVEMNTVRSHVLNYKVYKMLAMKVDELRSTVVGAWDIDALRSKNKVFRARLSIAEDAMAQAVLQLTKSQNDSKDVC
ncbi:hypothetical protein Fot_32543 [Forsythia ovata]|uniref:Uncharacterized protein n=1 Tax=Forsythia ovata TaxID=205694 RepID=A0ABD1T843_9LAMI